VTYYGQGVGTGNVVDRFSGGAFGRGLEENIHDAYRFLIANYEPGDEIYIFGFSRGAYTARSLGGMIRKCGVLKREAVGEYHNALELYRSAAVKADDPPALAFREKHSLCGREPVAIQLIGVWDTVGALGIPLRGLRWVTRKDYQFHDTELSQSVKFAYHALAIDEHRGPFEPTLWMAKAKPGQTIEQVWFCGAHSDVGGGYPERGLSDLALDWMIAKARGAGLAFDAPAMAALPLHPNHRETIHDSKKGVYNVTRGLDRPIGLASPGTGDPPDAAGKNDPTQSLHPSVLKRWDEDASYRPKSLREYFQRIGDPRGR
jgi:uncharacterized protein (DUF2235 family)